MSWSRRLVQLASQHRAGVITLVFAVGIATFVLVNVDWPGGSTGPFENSGDTDPSVLDAVYEDLIDAITVEDKVLYSRRVMARKGADSQFEYETWTDQSTYSYREHYNGEPHRIVVGADSYEPNATRLGYGIAPARTCHDRFEQAIAALLNCESSLRDLEVRVDLNSSYKGTSAIDIIATGEVNADGLLYVEEHTYLDKETLLPLAVVINRRGWMSDGRRITFEHSFVARSSLPDDFFDPASIGAVPIDFAKQLDTDVGIQLYWLGTESPGVPGLPRLVLDNVNVRPPDGRGTLTRRASLYYNGPRELATGMLSIDEWALADWEADVAKVISPERNYMPAGGLWWTWPCTESSELSVPDGTATIYWRVELDHEQYPIEQLISSDEPLPPGPCLPGEPDEFLAQVELGETFIVIHPKGPYNSREALEEVVQFLVPVTE